MKTANSKRGSILVTVLFLVSVLALLVATVANDSMQTMKTVGQSGRDSQAKYAAYAGLEKVMNELRQQEDYRGVPLSGTRHGHLADSLTQLDKISFDVEIWNNMRETPGEDIEPIDAKNGVKVQPDTVYLISEGSDITTGQEVLLTSMAGTARRIRPVFEDAAYARSKLIAEGNTLVDAWDSEGWKEYVYGGFPGEPSSTPTPGGGGGGGGGHGGGGGGWDTPNTQDYEASLGTDSASGRTMRLLGDSKLNGHFRVGPGVSEAGAFSKDSGVSSTSGSSGGDDDGGSSTITYGVATAIDEITQIAGTKESSGVGGSHDPVKIDDKKTDMPTFRAPYQADDVLPAPVVNNPSVTVQVPNDYGPGTHAETRPPAPVALDPGGYESINVPNDQTLLLTSGVYYFHEEMKVSGKIEVEGSTPVVVFVGKKATFNDAKINSKGKSSAFQLCFTDEIKDELELDAIIPDLLSYFDGTSAGATAGGPIGGATLEEMVKNIVAPVSAGPDGEDPQRQGASLLTINGGEFTGSISGKNLVAKASGAEIFGGIMGNIIKANNSKLHQDLALKGSNLMSSGGWELEGVHQLR